MVCYVVRMIEVEQKFLLKEGDVERLQNGATFVREYTMDDAYYDTGDCALGRKDQWLRLRNGRWELKAPLHGYSNTGTAMQQYDELEDDDSIRNFLKMSGDGALADDLAQSGYAVIARFLTTRRKFKKEEFTIDFDFADYGDSTYEIVEIELMVHDQSEMDTAAVRIQQFAKQYGLTAVPVRGKLIEYFKRKRPDIYETLKSAGVVKVIC